MTQALSPVLLPITTIRGKKQLVSNTPIKSALSTLSLVLGKIEMFQQLHVEMVLRFMKRNKYVLDMLLTRIQTKHFAASL